MSRSILGLATAVALVCFAQTTHAANSAKAVVYSDGRIVYYYDDVDHSSDTGYVQQFSPTQSSAKSPSIAVTSIVIDSSYAGFKPTSLAYYFWGLKDAISITGIENIDTTEATSMASMFRACNALASLDVSRFDTSKVSGMQYMFLSCSSLKELDISSFSSAALTTVESMFQGCSSITSIYASAQFDLSRLSSGKSSTFYNCTNKLKGDNGTTWSSQKVSGNYGKIDDGTESPGYFSRVYLTLTIDASDFAAKRIASVAVAAEGAPVDPTELGGTTYYVVKGAPLVVTYTAESGYEFAGEATYSDTTFAVDGITADTAISGNSIPTATAGLSKYTLTIDDSYFTASHIASVAVTKTSDGSVVDPEQDGTYMMSAGIGFVITYTAEAGYEFGEAFTYVDSTYAEDGILQDETRSGADIPTATVFPVYTLSFDKSALDYRHISTVAVKDTNGVAIAAAGEVEGEVHYNITKHGNFTISYSAIPGYVFGHYISVSNDVAWATAGFMGDVSLSTNDVPAGLSISSSQIKGVVEDSDPGTITFYDDAVAHVGTVYARKALTGTPSWMNLTTVKRVVIDSSMRAYGQGGDGFQYLFCGLSAVTNFEGLANLRTGNATTFYQMFYDCRAVTELDVSKFKTSKARIFESMFRGCASLTTLDLSSFSSEAVTGCAYMFNGCYSLTTIYARPALDMRQINSPYIFTGCSKLVGGNGTKANATLQYYAQYTHIDEPDDPGYFTLKPYAGSMIILW